jgi:hypothetical protein
MIDSFEAHRLLQVHKEKCGQTNVWTQGPKYNLKPQEDDLRAENTRKQLLISAKKESPR